VVIILIPRFITAILYQQVDLSLVFPWDILLLPFIYLSELAILFLLTYVLLHIFLAFFGAKKGWFTTFKVYVYSFVLTPLLGIIDIIDIQSNDNLILFAVLRVLISLCSCYLTALGARIHHELAFWKALVAVFLSSLIAFVATRVLMLLFIHNL
jgi:hypothetical protein